jgi:hypothetical protein
VEGCAGGGQGSKRAVVLLMVMKGPRVSIGEEAVFRLKGRKILYLFSKLIENCELNFAYN